MAQYDASYTVTDAVHKSGHHLFYWSTNLGITVNPNQIITNLKNDLTLTAVWGYKVTYNLNGGSWSGSHQDNNMYNK